MNIVTKWTSITLLLIFSVLGNHFHLDIFYSVAFIFGSISVLIALRLHGIVVAAIIALFSGIYTYYLWGHPYAIIIFTIEAISVGLLLRLGIKSLIVADAIYWLFLGVPMVWLFYSQVMGMASDVALLILLKQPINAIINAIIATFLLLTFPKLWRHRNTSGEISKIGITELVSSLLITTAFVSALTIVLHESGSVVANLENHTEFELRTTSSIFKSYIDKNNRISRAGLSLEEDKNADDIGEIKYILLDKEKVIISTNLQLDEVKAFLSTGIKKNITDNMTQWLPKRNGEPLLVWWKKAYYYMTTEISVGQSTTLIVLKSSEHLIALIRKQQIQSLSLLLLVIAIGIVFSYIISNWLNKTIIALSWQTKNLSSRLRKNEQIIWPQSRIKEFSDLSHQAEEMSDEMAILIDKLVGEQEWLESRVKISNEIIDESFARSSAIIETAVEGIVSMDDAGFIESFNPAAEKLFMRSLDSVVGIKFSELFDVKNQLSNEELLRQILVISDESGRGHIIELDAYTGNGDLVPVEITVSVVRLRHKIIYTAFINDISERKQAEILKNEFISNVSHELRTPLTSIRGAIGLMASSKLGVIPEKFTSMLNITLENSERLVRLINDILDIQKLEAGGLVFVLRPERLAPIIEQCVEQNIAYGDQFGVNIKLINSEKDIVIKTEPDRLNQVLTNLISNAVKFSPEGQDVTILVSTTDHHVRISVSDKGPGIPQDYHETIFDKFSQVDGSTTRAKGGTGLGLNIAKSYVNRMDGEIGFDSVEGAGTTFFILIPIYQG